jgi:hypothetical protein
MSCHSELYPIVYFQPGWYTAAGTTVTYSIKQPLTLHNSVHHPSTVALPHNFLGLLFGNLTKPFVPYLGVYFSAGAFKIPQCLTTAAIVCGMGPIEAPHIKDGTSWTIPGKPSLIRRLLLILFDMGLRKNLDKFVSKSKKTFPEPDKLLLDQPEMAKVYINMLREAFRSGISGVHHEAMLYTRPWQFNLQDVSGEVHLWHGELDVNVPIPVGRHVADAIPNCQATFLKDEAHISLPHNHIQEILSVLT